MASPIPSTFPQYGPIIGVHNIDAAIIDVFKKWYRSYLNEVARQNAQNFARLATPRSYRAGSDINFMPEDQRPCVIVVNNGLDNPPVRRGQGSDGIGQRVESTWEYQIAIQIVAQGRKDVCVPRAHELAMMYVAAARVMLTNVASETLALLVDWKDEFPGDLEPDSDRTSAIGVCVFNVTVPQAHVWGTAPLQPEADDVFDPESPVWPKAVNPNGVTIIKIPTIQPSPPTKAFDQSFNGAFDVEPR